MGDCLYLQGRRQRTSPTCHSRLCNVVPRLADIESMHSATTTGNTTKGYNTNNSRGNSSSNILPSKISTSFPVLWRTFLYCLYCLYCLPTLFWKFHKRSRTRIINGCVNSNRNKWRSKPYHFHGPLNKSNERWS